MTILQVHESVMKRLLATLETDSWSINEKHLTSIVKAKRLGRVRLGRLPPSLTHESLKKAQQSKSQGATHEAQLTMSPTSEMTSLSGRKSILGHMMAGSYQKR